MHEADLGETLDALRDAYLTLCRALEGAGGVASADEGDVAWGMTPMPIGAFNRVVRVRLAGDQADARIREVADRYDVAGVPGSWWIDPQSTPSDLGGRLERLGFVSEAVPAMRVEAADVPELELPAGLTLSWATDAGALRSAMQLVAAGFGLPDELGDRMADLMASAAGRETSVRTVVARLDDKPVAAAQGVHIGRAVGIYNVATLGEARGRGIGAAVTIAVLRDAVARGARFGMLESSDLGHPVYERIGFRDVATFQVYGRPES
jgi:ribosomal protein S18 acetylase RimI-like enzyme